MNLPGYIATGIVLVIVSIWIAVKIRRTRKERQAERAFQAKIQDWLQPLREKIAEMVSLYPDAKRGFEELEPELGEKLRRRMRLELLGPDDLIEGWTATGASKWEDHNQIHYKGYRLEQYIKEDIGKVEGNIKNFRAAPSIAPDFRAARANSPRLMVDVHKKLADLQKSSGHPDVLQETRDSIDLANKRYVKLEKTLPAPTNEVDWIYVQDELQSIKEALEQDEQSVAKQVEAGANLRAEVEKMLGDLPLEIKAAEKGVEEATHPSPRARDCLKKAKEALSRAQSENGADLKQVNTAHTTLVRVKQLLQVAEEASKRHSEVISAAES